MGFSKHVDTPNPLVSSELPRDNCAPSVVDGACGQDAVSTSPFFLLTLLPHPFPHSCFLVLFGFAPLPRKPTPMFGLFTSRCVHLTYWECPFFSSSKCMYMWLKDQEVHDVRMFECGCAVSSTLLPPGKHVVMSLTASRTITASQCCPLALRPPQLCDNTNHEQQPAQRGEDAGITMRRGGQGKKADVGMGV